MLDPNEYLKDDFDVSKLTVPNLRSILVEHNIDFPSNSTKPDLIKFFNNEVKPNSNKILKKYNNIKPSSKNIIDMTENKYIEPSKITDDDKIIPLKRQSNSSNNKNKNKKKIRKVNQSSNLSDSSNSSLLSPNNSFLSMEKFELNENDNIFKGPIDNIPLTLLPKTKFSKKSTKEILSNFDKSLPSSYNLTLKSKSTTTTPIKNYNNNNNNKSIDYSITERINKTINDNVFVNNIFNSYESNSDIINNDDNVKNISLKDELNDIFDQSNDINNLKGPTKNITKSIINISDSDKDEENSIIDDKINDDDILVSTINDVQSFSTLETNDVSFSDNSIKVNDDNELSQEPIKKEKEEETGEDKVQIENKIEEEIKENDIIENELIDKSKSKINLLSILNKSLKVTFKFLLTSSILFSIIGLLSIREVKLNTGYCGFEQPDKLLDIWGNLPYNNNNDKLSILKPYINKFESTITNNIHFDCEKCPENGTCNLNKLKCNSGYIKKSSIDSLFGLIPLKEFCEFDSLRREKLDYMFKYTLSYLHRHNDNQLTLDEVHDYLKSTKPTTMTYEEFEEYWKIFIETEINNEDELNININTKQITLSHRTPSEYYTRTFGNVERGKKSKKLFQKTPPTVDVMNYYTVSK